MVITAIRDGINVCLYMGKKPFVGMILPITFTMMMVSGVYFNNIRRGTVRYEYNKLQGMSSIEEE
eukprot:CAMPEP_0178404644 /NCGR_PEP_ID=MMETSP0689_2-20121128/17992_1 /TAXON_ID=160604 /ORGANISM="Amphidinium massartii, Strain CS-259" /LENGTH=64 /DNA_ID=CAMNT_0020025639 /DNA_START=124 /DNA_END=318 /DNA_ORIENTATION=-